MMPVERPRSEATSFPFLGPAVAVLAIYAILAVALPPSVLRTAVAITAFFAMGYCALALIVGGSLRISAAEILAFTVGLTILITSISALAVSIVGIPITEFAVIIIGLPLGVVAWLLRRPRVRPWIAVLNFGRRFFDFSEYSRAEKGIAGALFIAVIGALVVLITLAGVGYPDRLSPALAITGIDGTPGSLPSQFVVGRPETIVVHVLGGSTSASYVVRIRLVPANATGNESFHGVTQTAPLVMDAFSEYSEPIAVGAGMNWTKPYSIQIDVAGTFELRFELVDATTVLFSSRLPILVA